MRLVFRVGGWAPPLGVLSKFARVALMPLCRACCESAARIKSSRAVHRPSQRPPRCALPPALSVGDTWLLHSLWQRLGFDDAFRRVLRSGRSSFDAERLLRVNPEAQRQDEAARV